MEQNTFRNTENPDMHSVTSKTIRLCEAVYDIAFEAGELMGTGQIAYEDSRELFWNILQWAEEFEQQFDDKKSDYLTEILDYADKKLNESYGDRRESND